MKKFMIIYHAPQSAQEMMANATPEDAKKGMEPWIAWQKKFEENIVDMGSPIGMSKKVTKSGVSDSDSTINGYSIIKAEDMDAALKVVENHPHLEWIPGAEVEVCEFLPLPGME